MKKPSLKACLKPTLCTAVVALLLAVAVKARAGKVDFLWVIDNSPSMANSQDVLSSAAGSIANQLALAACPVDWRMAVAYTDEHLAPTSDDVCPGAPGPGRRIVCPFTRDMNVFRNGTSECAYVQAGTCGNSQERGFNGARVALDRFVAGTGCAAVPGGECFLRPDARLAVVFMTDTGEQTPASEPPPGQPDDSVQSWINYFTDFNLVSSGLQHATVHGILCPVRPTKDDPSPCSDRLADPTLFDRYSQVISALGGTEGSIRGTDGEVSTAIMDIVDAAIAGSCCGNGVVDPGEDCDDGNVVDGDCCSSSCRFEPATTLCRASAGACDTAEFCTGSSGSCPADGFKAATFQCRGATGVCDAAEFCTGTSASCPADAMKPATTECRAKAGACDVAETCTGTTATCPADRKSTDVCRPATGACDVAETCDGSSNDCPADVLKAATVKCRNAAGDCDLAEFCTGTSGACPVDTFKPSTVKCRNAAGVCDAAEFCTGSGAACPADAFLPSTTPCRAAAGVCDVAETCTGSSAACPADAKSTAVCRAAAGACDVAEVCDGTSNNCPADVLVAAGVECRSAAGECDVAEACTGSNAACPADAKSTAVCRAAAGQCDVEERCDGHSDTCPTDAVRTPDGFPCDDGNPCTHGESCWGGHCTGGETVTCAATGCRAAGVCDPSTGQCTGTTMPDGTACDDGNACTRNTSCWGGECIRAEALDCDDADLCTEDTCDVTRGCLHTHVQGFAALTCLCDGGLEKPVCSTDAVPHGIDARFARACTLIKKAGSSSGKPAHKLMKKAAKALKKAGKLSATAGRTHKLSSECATSLSGTIGELKSRALQASHN